ncbi:protein LphB [Legionella maioricensis]|uniref:Protein LphB n=1 Tax=Legionella maioricensis TaxID=2896528 RepID=A0A9X2D2T2_9GAMM|nr:protein LphB [Legionella maioricensis]MCL9685202.1 protein LphB [Legionella maioricensis]MCL9688419.1 protein LphB [Legionella maioricensis]
MNSLSRRKELFLAAVIAVFCAYDLIATIISIWDFTTDDAYISWVYARQLVNGNGLHWHVDLPRVEGYSNFLWIIIAAFVIKCKLPLITTIKFISCFSLGAGLFFLYRIGRLFFSPLLSMLPIFIFSHFLGVAWWTVSGMESMFYCALSLLLIWQCAVALGYHPVEENNPAAGIHKVSTRAWALTSVALLLLCLTRFEGAIWGIPVLLFVCCHLKQHGVRTVFAESRTIYIWGAVFFICFLLPYAVYFIWRLDYFGHWIPNSYRCKALKPGQIFTVDLDYLRVIFPLLIAALPYFLSVKDCRHWLLWSPSVLYALLLWEANPVIAHFLRLFLGPFALFTLLPVLGVIVFLGYFKQHKMDPKLLATGGIILLTVLFIPGNESLYLQALLKQYQERTQIRLAVAKIINTQAAKGSTVLFGDCGIVPFKVSLRKDIRFIDSDCLNNAELTQAPYNNDLNLYAEHIAAQVKPEWVITTYEPLLLQGNYPFEMLKRKHFFDQYQLIITLESGWIYKLSSKKSAREIDYVYKVYKRREQ